MKPRPDDEDAGREDVLVRLFVLLKPFASAAQDLNLTPETDLVGTLGLDSPKLLDLLLDIEDEFDVVIPMEALADVRTAGDLAAVIEDRLGGP